RRLRMRPPALDRGSGTVWVLTFAMLVWACVVAIVVVASVRVDRHRAAAAADLAALAGAEQAASGADRACAVARRTAHANQARLVDCTVSGLTVTVTVAVPGRIGPAQLTAVSRAGPVGAAHKAVSPAWLGRFQQRVQEPDRSRLAERLVAVTAFGRLDAGRAPGSALAGRDRVPCGAQPVPRSGVAAFREPCASLVPVVDEDGEQPGVGVQRSGHPADIPPVAGGEQRQQADRRVLGC